MDEIEILDKDDVEEILRDFKKKVESILKEKFVEAILFGSYARGDYEHGSDIDLLLVVKEKLTRKEKERISKITADLSLTYDVVITCFDYLYTDFRDRNSPFLLNVRKEGVAI